MIPPWPDFLVGSANLADEAEVGTRLGLKRSCALRHERDHFSQTFAEVLRY